LKCTITMDYPVDPVETDCGHVFEYASLVSWFVNHRTCPSCRTVLPRDGFHRSLFIRRILKQTNLIKDVDTPLTPILTRPSYLQNFVRGDDLRTVSVDASSVPDLEDIVTPPTTPTFSGHPHRRLFTFGNFMTNEPNITRASRSVALGFSHLVNPSSSNVSLLRTVVERSNHSFLCHRDLVNQHCMITKYVYRHRGDIQSAMRSACEHGYYVYDLFALSPNRFCIYSLCYRYDGSSHTLDAM